MLVGDRMTRDVHTLLPDATVSEALRTMKAHSVHRLPVVDEADNLVGIVSYMDLGVAQAAGRAAEPVSNVMTTDVTTVTEYDPVEQAATLMRREHIGGLPVVRSNKVIGIITDGDIFDLFSELLGIGRPGIRLALELPAQRDVLLDLLQAIAERKGEIIAMGSMRQDAKRTMVLKVAGISEEEAQRAAHVVGVEIRDIFRQE